MAQGTYKKIRKRIKMPLIQFNISGAKRTAFFSFIPKTGGTALIETFKLLGAQVYLHEENNPTVGVLHCPTQHLHYELSSSLINIPSADHSFTIVRHPFARAKSDYKWAFRKATTPRNIPLLDEWLENLFEAYLKNPYIFDNHIRPQTEFIGKDIKSIFYYENGLTIPVEETLSNMKLKYKGDKIEIPETNAPSDLMNKVVAHQPEKNMLRSESLVKDFYNVDYVAFGYD
jgi:hypothetical protein